MNAVVKIDNRQEELVAISDRLAGLSMAFSNAAIGADIEKPRKLLKTILSVLDEGEVITQSFRSTVQLGSVYSSSLPDIFRESAEKIKKLCQDTLDNKNVFKPQTDLPRDWIDFNALQEGIRLYVTDIASLAHRPG